MRKIGLISLGCDKNRVDSELLLGSAVDNDFEIVVDPMQADVLVVNTCAFIESARREAIEAIFDLVNVKNATGAKLVVTGCLAQRYPQEIYNEIPEVDAVIGADRYSQFGKIISGLFDENQTERLLSVRNDLTTIEQGKRVLTTPKHYAYLRIADGCNNFCTYCSIPYIRGRYRSRKIEEVVSEATQLVKNGAKELILVAQDLTDYGIDLFGKRSLVSLLNELCKIEELDTIRLLYCYPEHVDDELINCIADNPKIAKYIDLPLQHVNDRILKRMNRKTDKQEIIECIKKLRDNIFGMTIRSTFICGFPGETEEDVNELGEFLKEQKLNNVGFFEYCREEGTPAASYPDQVSEKDKHDRLTKLASIQNNIVYARNIYHVGSHEKVTVDSVASFDEKEGKYTYVCRTRDMAPLIDGVVYVSSKKELQLGEKYKVLINSCTNYDLIGEIEE